ncbi:Protein IDA-LIKE 2 [Fagus crenata]|uniref:Uncharacterized protein n=1 Tax=Fagus sylvatica TaxID=28930 RepID=A0A2N9EK84_FAGSY
MGKSRLGLALGLLLMLTVMVMQTHGASHSHVFKMIPTSQNSPHNFVGFLPKATPIPPSGPSRKHNNIGLQSSRPSPETN